MSAWEKTLLNVNNSFWESDADYTGSHVLQAARNYIMIRATTAADAVTHFYFLYAGLPAAAVGQVRDCFTMISRHFHFPWQERDWSCHDVSK